MRDSLDLWARGKITLRQIKNYSDEELYALSRMGYFYLMQGKNAKARTVFEGLVAIDPQNDFYYRALGVTFQKLGNDDLAIQQYTLAIRLNPGLPHAYVNRAEIYISRDEMSKAEDDLRNALERMGPKDELLSKKTWALLKVASVLPTQI